ncbi:MAG: helix-hairpin-helix domain-containing protein [Ilumatobacteraceae bacterium]
MTRPPRPIRRPFALRRAHSTNVESLREWWRWLGWRRVVAVAAAAPFAAVAVWWMVQLPAPPVENFIPTPPLTNTAVGSSGVSAPFDPTMPDVLSPLETVAPARIAVHVVGAVQSPGVYHLPSGARGDDALRAAGGPADNADLRRVNLAATLLDGEQFVVPRVGERLTTTVPPSRGALDGASGGSASVARGLVDLNTATVAELDRLPGVGPSTARAIVDHRSRNGPFASVDDLLAVRGIGPAKLAELKPFVRV